MVVLRASRLFVSALFLSLLQWALASSSIVGSVTVKGPDAPVGPIANAFVMVANPATPKQVLAVGQTDSTGAYSISGLAAGTYRVTFSTPGFLQGILSTFVLVDGQTVEINAQLVPSLTGTEVAKNNVKDETAYTIHNPNPFAVHYTWQLPQHHASGSGNAPPGDSVIDPQQWPHTENISLFVDGNQVQKVTTTVVAPPIILGNLTGRVQSTSGASLGGVALTLTDASNTPLGSTFSLADGSYSFSNEPAGSYTLTYALAGYVGASQIVTLASGGGAVPTETLTPIAPPPTSTVNVTVSDTSGAGAPGAAVTIDYANGTSATGATDGNGFISFTKQPVGVAATITAVGNDSFNRLASANTSGFVSGTNSVSIVLPPLPTGSISGIVTDASGGGALGGVMVAILDASDNVIASTLTGPDGSYTVPGLKQGTYSLTFSLANYQTSSTGGAIVQPGGNTAEPASLATSLALVNVTLLDGSNGLPATRSYVQIVYSDGTTSAQAFANFSAGLAQLANQPSGLGATLQAVDQDGSGRTATLQVPGGFAPGANSFTMTFPSLNGTLGGVVSDAFTGLPLPGVTVVATDYSGASTFTTTTAADGSYSFNLPATVYNLTFSVPGYQSMVDPKVLVQAGLATTQSVGLSSTSVTVNVTVTEAATGIPAAATVSISYANGKSAGPLPTNGSGFVSFFNQPSGVSATVTAVSMDPLNRTATQSFPQGYGPGVNTIHLALPTTQSGSGVITGIVRDAQSGIPLAGVNVVARDTMNLVAATATTDPIGQYNLQGLANGLYSVVYTLANYQTLTINGVAVTAPFPTSVPASMTPVVQVPTATVNVSVVDGITKSAVPSSVTISYADKTSAGPISTDANGQAQFTGQETGVTATVQATALDGSGRTGQQLFSTGFSAGANSVGVTVTLPLQSGAIGGTVTDASTGAVLAGVSVTVLDSNGNVATSMVTTKAGGYSDKAIDEGTYSVTFALSGYQTQTIAGVVVAPGTSADASAALVPNPPVTSTVQVLVYDGYMGGVFDQVAITYADGSPSATGTTGKGGDVAFSNQPLGVAATVTATAGDGSGRSTTLTFPAGFSTNSRVYITLPLTTSSDSISGVVTDGATGQPLAGVSIQVLSGKPAAIGYTGPDGSYSFTGLTDPSYSLTFSLSGYTQQTLDVSLDSVQNVSLLRMSTADVTVNVVNASNVPVSGATVTVSYSDGSPSASGTTGLKGGSVSFSGQPVGSTATIFASTADGRSGQVTQSFVAGANTVTVQLGGGTSSGAISGSVTYGKTFLPGVSISVVDWNSVPVASTVTDFKGAYAVSGLSAGSYTVTFSLSGYQTLNLTAQAFPALTTTLNASMTPSAQQLADVTVTVLDGQSPYLRGATVTIAYADGSKGASGITSPTGSVSFSGQPVGVMATITATSADLRTGTANTVFASGPNAVSVSLPSSSASLVGTVTDRITGAPLSGVSVVVTDAFGGTAGSAQTLIDGTFVIPLGVGIFNVTYSAQGYTTQALLASLTAGTMTTQNVALIPSTGSIHGNVTDESNKSPLGGVTVTIVNTNTNSTVATVATDSSGNYSATGIPIGPYVVTFSLVGYQPQTVNAYVMDPNGTVANGALVAQAAPTTINGTVSDGGGAPLANVSVVAYDAFTNAQVATTTTANDGTYLLSLPGGGIYNVNYTLSGYSPQRALNLKMAAGNNFAQNETLALADATVTVTVYSGGNAAGGATVTIDFGVNNPPTGPLVGQTDPATGQIQFTNVLVGVPATITVSLTDGTLLPPQTVAFASGATSPTNNVVFLN